MAKFMQTNQAKHKSATRNNQTSRMSSEQYLRKVRKNITRQALLALLTIVLTLVIVFAMTSAWCTNIAQTSGLVFEAEAWGFDGKITVAEGLTKAAPGDDGVVHLTVANNSDAISAISVNINKMLVLFSAHSPARLGVRRSPTFVFIALPPYSIPRSIKINAIRIYLPLSACSK